MDDGPPGAGDGFHRALDQVFARLSQHLDGHVVRDAVFLDQLADKIEIRVRRGGKGHLDFLKADFHQELEEP